MKPNKKINMQITTNKKGFMELSDTTTLIILTMILILIATYIILQKIDFFKKILGM